MTRHLFAAILLLAFASLTAAATPVVIRGPYLQQTTDHSVILRWRTDTPSQSWVRYGEYPGPRNTSASDTTLVTEHEVRLEGLLTNIQYGYAVGTNTSDLSTPAVFWTHPTPGISTPARIWILGDSGGGTASAALVRDGYTSFLGAGDTQVWLMLGDNAYNTGTDAEYQTAVFDMYPDYLATTSVWPTRGNHDQTHAGPNNDYQEFFSLPDSGQAGGIASGTEAYYSFDYGDIHFICLDTEQGDLTPPSTMLTWLQDDLAANTRLWTIAYAHHGPYSKGSHDTDNPLESGGRHVNMRDHVLPILENWGVDLFLAGHSHSYERSYLMDEHYGLSTSLVDSMVLSSSSGDPQVDAAYYKPTAGPSSHEGTVYVIAGASSKIGGGSMDHPVMATSLSELGSLVLDVNGAHLFGTFVDGYGNERDSFTILKGTPVGVGYGRSPEPPVVTLGSPFPNPFTRAVRFEIDAANTARVQVDILDLQGRRVRRLFSGSLPEGVHTFAWNGQSLRGRVPSGVYWIRLQAGHHSTATRVLLTR